MSVLCQFFATTMEAKVIPNQIFCCGLDIFAYAKCSTIVELCLSVIFNIVLFGAAVVLLYEKLLSQHDEVNLSELVSWGPLQISILNLTCITTNTILLILELQKVRSGFSIKNWNLVTRIIWTMGLGKNL